MNRRRRQRGTAILEFVLSVPLLALVIAAAFFFGWAMRNQQRMRTADRFAGWRAVEVAEPTPEEINTWFFAGRGQGIELSSGSGPDGTLEALADAAGDQSDPAQSLMRELLDKDCVPRGRSETVHSGFATSVDFWRRLAEGAMESSHVRDGRPWRRGEVDIGRAVRDLYLDELDVKTADVAGSDVGRALQSLYLQGW
jgi:hypothetical protein